MTTIAHISDIHFGREVPTVIEGLLDALYELKPDLLIASGDITQRATDEQFHQAQQFFHDLPWPAFIVPGNHDLSATNLVERFFYPWQKWQHYINPELEPVLSQPNYTVVGVNTARAAGWYFDWSRGQIEAQQITRITQLLTLVPETNLRLLVAHHPFWLPAKYAHRDLVQGRNQALQAFQSAGVDIILSGHIHLAYTRLMQGVIISHTGTTFSDRLLDHNPNSFNIIRGNREQLEVTVMAWHSPQFEPISQQLFKRQTGNWQELP